MNAEDNAMMNSYVVKEYHIRGMKLNGVYQGVYTYQVDYYPSNLHLKNIMRFSNLIRADVNGMHSEEPFAVMQFRGPPQLLPQIPDNSDVSPIVYPNMSYPTEYPFPFPVAHEANYMVMNPQGACGYEPQVQDRPKFKESYPPRRKNAKNWKSSNRFGNSRRPKMPKEEGEEVRLTISKEKEGVVTHTIGKEEAVAIHTIPKEEDGEVTHRIRIEEEEGDSHTISKEEVNPTISKNEEFNLAYKKAGKDEKTEIFSDESLEGATNVEMKNVSNEENLGEEKPEADLEKFDRWNEKGCTNANMKYVKETSSKPFEQTLSFEEWPKLSKDSSVEAVSSSAQDNSGISVDEKKHLLPEHEVADDNESDQNSPAASCSQDSENESKTLGNDEHKSMLRILRIKENPEEDLKSLVIKLILKSRNILLEKHDILECERIGRMENRFHRVIVVTFKSKKVCQKVLRSLVYDDLLILPQLSPEVNSLRLHAERQFGPDNVVVIKDDVDVRMPNGIIKKFKSKSEINDFLAELFKMGISYVRHINVHPVSFKRSVNNPMWQNI